MWVCITGDGFQMNMQELATAMCVRETPVTGASSTTTIWDGAPDAAALYWKRYGITCLRKREGLARRAVARPNGGRPPYEPDFVKLAELRGAYGIQNDGADQVEDALRQAKARGRTRLR